MNENLTPQTRGQQSSDTIQRKKDLMKTTLRNILTTLTLFALLSTAFANGNQDLNADFDTLTMLEIAALHGWTQPEVAVVSSSQPDFDTQSMLEIATSRGWTQPEVVVLASSQPDFDTQTMLEIAASRGWTRPEVVAWTDLPQFADATIEYLTDLASFVANRHYDGDVVAACHGIIEIFESDAQMNRVVAVLTGS